LIITFLLEEFVQGGAASACHLQLQLKTERRKQL
jgi:hypothetical protein